jgi:hypothetical protein
LQEIADPGTVCLPEEPSIKCAIRYPCHLSTKAMSR